MGKMKNIVIDIINFKEKENFKEKDFITRQKKKREYYIKQFENEEIEEKGAAQIKLIF